MFEAPIPHCYDAFISAFIFTPVFVFVTILLLKKNLHNDTNIDNTNSDDTDEDNANADGTNVDDTNEDNTNADDINPDDTKADNTNEDDIGSRHRDVRPLIITTCLFQQESDPSTNARLIKSFVVVIKQI